MQNLENKDEPLDENATVYPRMCMSSVEPVRLREKFNSFFANPLVVATSRYRLDLTVFQKEEKSDYFLTYVISAIKNLTPPEFFTSVVSDIESNDARDFVARPLDAFHGFRKAILLFDNRAYPMKEFEERITEWRKSLEGIVTDGN